MDLVSLLFSFHGRINRLQYWLGNLAITVGGFVLNFAAALITAPSAQASSGALTALALGLVMLAMGWCGLALQVKRFHDRGRSGYWALAPFAPACMMAVAIIGGVATNAPANVVMPQVMPWLGILMLINLWLFVDLGLLAGTDGPNKYDHTPPAPSGDASTPWRSSIGGAAQAMERAIASSAAAAATPVPAPAPRPAVASASLRTGAAPSFGRRAAR